MNGNISKPGIKLDLNWMHRAGIAGFQTFHAALATPKVVPHRLVYMTPEWKDAFRYATQLADQFGMEGAITGSPGWSETGGPWVPASQGMKKYVWSETDIEGAKPFTGKRNHPPTNTGSNPEKSLKASCDGKSFRTIAKLTKGGAPEETISFPAVTAKYFRVVFKRTPPPPMPAWAKNMDLKSLGIKIGPPTTTYKIAELELHPGARVSHFEEKAAFVPVPDLYKFATPKVSPANVIGKSDVSRELATGGVGAAGTGADFLRNHTAIACRLGKIC